MNLKKKGFQLPDKIRFDEETLSSTYGKLIVEPLERGFGTTLGNALRRVLLSSLRGSAITAVRIRDVHHEFSAIPGVREDVTEILLNLKQVRLKMLTDAAMKILRLEKSGEGKFAVTLIDKATNPCIAGGVVDQDLGQRANLNGLASKSRRACSTSIADNPPIE